MKKYETIDWTKYPSIEECTDMGDTNGNCINEGINDIMDRVIEIGKIGKAKDKEE